METMTQRDELVRFACDSHYSCGIWLNVSENVWLHFTLTSYYRFHFERFHFCCVSVPTLPTYSLDCLHGKPIWSPIESENVFHCRIVCRVFSFPFYWFLVGCACTCARRVCEKHMIWSIWLAPVIALLLMAITKRLEKIEANLFFCIVQQQCCSFCNILRIWHNFDRDKKCLNIAIENV